MKHKKVRNLADYSDVDDIPADELARYAFYACGACDGTGVTRRGDVCKCVRDNWMAAQVAATRYRVKVAR